MKKNKFTKETLLSGIEKIFSNAKSLIDEADLLNKNNFPTRAYSLLQLSIEELGKIILLDEVLMDVIIGKDIYYEDISIDYTNHPTKSKLSSKIDLIYLQYLMDTKKDYDDFRESINNDYSNAGLLNQLKNESLYVYYENGNFYNPREKISTVLVEEIFQKAKRRYHVLKVFSERSNNDLEKLAREIRRLE